MTALSHCGPVAAANLAKYLLTICLLGPVAIGPVKSVRAAEAIGNTQSVVNRVTGSGAIGTRSLAASDPVYRAEKISADSGSRGELSLVDGTKLLVGENSSITLDRFVLADRTFRSGTVRLARGAFRFISGESHETVTISTPLADIGVRGTVLDVYALVNVTRVVLLNGEIIACSKRGTAGRPRECVVLRRACDVVEFPQEGGIRREPFLYSRQRPLAERREQFTLTENQLPYGRDFRAFMGGCSARAAEELRGGHQTERSDSDIPEKPKESESPRNPPPDTPPPDTPPPDTPPPDTPPPDTPPPDTLPNDSTRF